MRFAAALLLSLAAVAVPAAAQEAPQVSPILTSEEARDPWTFAEPETARVTHVALDLTLDFEAKQVGGTATLDVLAAAGADKIVLDSQGLQISQVTDEDGAPLAYTLAPLVLPNSECCCRVPSSVTDPPHSGATLRVMMLITPPIASEP